MLHRNAGNTNQCFFAPDSNDAIAYARMNSQTDDYGQAVTDKMVSEVSGVDM
jgi:hypothetical protein